MAASDLTELETAILRRALSEHAALPALSALTVRSREDTGVGRYTHLEWTGEPLPETHVITPGWAIGMEGVEHPGLGVLLFVAPGELTLELHTYVGDWDGVERHWRIKESADDR